MTTPSSSRATDGNEPAERNNISISSIRQALAARQGDNGSGEGAGISAAVAMIFAGDEQAPDLCVIRRAERAGDPWSGHMAFPGGKREAADASVRAAAQRETLEEVGLRLRESHYLAALPHMPVRAGGRDTGIILFPFVYYLGARRGRLSPNGEVAEAFWIPLSHILDSRNQVEMPLQREGQKLIFPSILYGGHHIWGVTYRVLMQFAEALGRSLPGPEHHP
ncbi:MAG: CoA pyrophosphatase [SAR324 cluster bacterium]|nr:CoA pyrophosphatase [SAR324 cluster bacterium]